MKIAAVFLYFSATLTGLAFFQCGHALGQSSSQPKSTPTWEEVAGPRLKAIYERGAYRARQFRGRWLPDSKGYVVKQRDPETNQTNDVIYDSATGKRRQGKIENQQSSNGASRSSPDRQFKIEYRGGNLFLKNVKDGSQKPITRRDPKRDISYANPTWNNRGTHVLFSESDRTDVPMRATLVPNDPSYPGVRQRRFARVGEKITARRVGVYDVKADRLQWLDLKPAPDGIYLGQIGWVGTTDEILVERMSRFRDKREFLIYDLKGGQKNIFEETNAAWAVGSQGKNAGLTWVDDAKAFIVISEKDSWRHAYLCSREKDQETLLTPGDFDIIDRVGVDETGGWFYFYASPENGTQQFLYRVPLNGNGKLERVTPADQPGSHTYKFSPDYQWAFHTYSTLDKPPVTSLIKVDGHEQIRTLENNQALADKMKSEYKRPTEFFQLNIGDGVTMDAWMLKPRDFDETKKYPVFVYVYGEPYAQTVLDRWGEAQIHFNRVVAELGYLVVSIDNRGTPAPKGAAWRRSVFGSLGPLSTEDQAAAIKELGRTRSYVDLSRVGIWGWSGGGSNTLNAMFRKPETYHVGIAVVPKPQPHLYNAWFQEIYMRTRQVNPEGYKKAAAINFAKGLSGKLLIVTGSGETNTHIQIIEGLVDRLIQLGKPFDYMVYPNRDHGLREGKGTEFHVRMLIARYLCENLPRGPR